jgi:signal recognition particle GTPase
VIRVGLAAVEASGHVPIKYGEKRALSTRAVGVRRASDRLAAALHDVRGRRKLDEDAICRVMPEIRLALLEADVNFLVRALMEELAAVRKAAKPTNVPLVLDAMTGQEAVSVHGSVPGAARHRRVVLTKLDGSARVGVALAWCAGPLQRRPDPAQPTGTREA